MPITMRSIAEQRNTIGCVNFLSNKAITIIPGASSTPLTQGFPPDANLEILAAIREEIYLHKEDIPEYTLLFQILQVGCNF